MAAALPGAAHFCGALLQPASEGAVLDGCAAVRGMPGRAMLLPQHGALHCGTPSSAAVAVTATNCTSPPVQRVFRMLSIVELWLLLVSTFVMLYAHYLQVHCSFSIVY